MRQATIGVGSGLQCERTPNTKSTSIFGTVVGIVARTYSLLKCYYCAALEGGQRCFLPRVCGAAPAWALPVLPRASRQFAYVPFERFSPPEAF